VTEVLKSVVPEFNNSMITRKIPVIAVDDEPLALHLLAGYIHKTPFLDLLREFENPVEAMEFLNEEPVELIFLDIHMPDLSGTQMARMLLNGPKIIFTTAYVNYALEGYKLNAVDYLLKPFTYDDFLQSAQKARRLIELERKEAAWPETSGDFLFLKSEYKVRRINFSDILYIEGLKDYVKVYLKNEQRPVLSISTLKNIEAKLPPDRFMRVHRSFIVNLEQVNTIERSRILFGNVRIPVGEQYKEKFEEFLNRNFL